MRNHLRIKPFLEKLDTFKLLKAMAEEEGWVNSEEELTDISEKIREAIDVEFWEQNPDLRFGQMMFNRGYDIFSNIYYLEEPDILMMCGYDDVEAFGWVSVMDKDQNLIDPVFRFINELSTDHLETMLTEVSEGKRLYPIQAIKMFQKELGKRGIEFQLSIDSLEFQYEKWAEDQVRRIMESLALDFEESIEDE